MAPWPEDFFPKSKLTPEETEWLRRIHNRTDEERKIGLSAADNQKMLRLYVKLGPFIEDMEKIGDEWVGEEEEEEFGAGGGGSIFPLPPDDAEQRRGGFLEWLTSFIGKTLGFSPSPSPGPGGAILDPMPAPSSPNLGPDIPTQPPRDPTILDPTLPQRSLGALFDPLSPQRDLGTILDPIPPLTKLPGALLASTDPDDYVRRLIGRSSADEPELTDEQQKKLFQQFLKGETEKVREIGEELGKSPEEVAAAQEDIRALKDYTPFPREPSETWANWLEHNYLRAFNMQAELGEEAERILEGPTTKPIEWLLDNAGDINWMAPADIESDYPEPLLWHLPSEQVWRIAETKKYDEEGGYTEAGSGFATTEEWVTLMMGLDRVYGRTVDTGGSMPDTSDPSLPQPHHGETAADYYRRIFPDSDSPNRFV